MHVLWVKRGLFLSGDHSWSWNNVKTEKNCVDEVVCERRVCCRFDSYECFRNLCCHSRFYRPFRCIRFVKVTCYRTTFPSVRVELGHGFALKRRSGC